MNVNDLNLTIKHRKTELVGLTKSVVAILLISTKIPSSLVQLFFCQLLSNFEELDFLCDISLALQIQLLDKGVERRLRWNIEISL